MQITEVEVLRKIFPDFNQDKNTTGRRGQVRYNGDKTAIKLEACLPSHFIDYIKMSFGKEKSELII